ncbi:DUF952 domain-containing protein [Hyphomonas sp.]|uniref:DUF952 domain-containing protein n=1 Tax=Hyphomonas sp. TaxID=87 RepID=UPI00391A2DA7
MTTLLAYKLLNEADWTAAQASGVTASAVDLADGYVHLSTAEQVRETARRYFAGAGRVRLLRFDLAALGDIRWEESRGGELFPHLYGPLEITKANAAWWLEPGPDGTPVFPRMI